MFLLAARKDDARLETGTGSAGANRPAIKGSASAQDMRQQAGQADDDEIEGDDDIEQPRHHQNEDAGNQGNDRLQGNDGHQNDSVRNDRLDAPQFTGGQTETP